MYQYWPCATRIREDGSEESLFTYDSALSMGKAREAIKCWKEAYGFNLCKCFIDVYEGDVKVMRVNVEG